MSPICRGHLDHSGASRTLTQRPDCPDGGRPSWPDLLAVGVMYYRVLTGRHPLWDVLGLPRELPWTGLASDQGPPSLGRPLKRILDALQRGFVSPDAISPVSKAESVLAMHLLRLTVSDSDHLDRLAKDAAGSIR